MDVYLWLKCFRNELNKFIKINNILQCRSIYFSFSISKIFIKNNKIYSCVSCLFYNRNNVFDINIVCLNRISYNNRFFFDRIIISRSIVDGLNYNG